MKNIFLTVVAFLILASCGGKSGSTSNPGPNPDRSFDPLKPAGVTSYASECDVDTETFEDGSRQTTALKRILKFREDTAGNPLIAYYKISYGDASCKTAFIETKLIASGTMTEEGRTFVGHFVEATHKLLRQDLVDSLNAAGACGISNWVLNTERNIFDSSCFKSDRAIYVEFVDPLDVSQNVFDLSYCEEKENGPECFHGVFTKI